MSFKVASTLKQWDRPTPASHKVSGDAAKAEGQAPDRKLTKPAAEPSPVSEKENRSLMSPTHTYNQIKGSSSRAQTLCAAGAWDQMTDEEITDALF